MYYFDSRVRFSETDHRARLSPQAIVDYFQDCSTFQTESLGVGFSYLEPKGLTWVLNYWQIVIEKYPVLGDEIRIGTFPYEFKSFMGKRNFFLEKDGEKIVKADSLWTLLDIKNIHPTKIPTEIQEKYKKEDPLTLDYEPRKIKISGEEEEEESFLVQRYHLDCNKHVNNGQYIKMAGVYLPSEFTVGQIRAEYKEQAFENDRIHPYVYYDKHKITVSLCKEDKKPYVVIEFKEKIRE